MKKLLIFSISIFLALSLCGCGADVATESAAATPTPAETAVATPEPTLTPTPTPTPIPEKVSYVAVNFKASAAITDDGDLYIWGNGQTKPLKVMENIQSVAIGNGFYMALTKAGELYEWGDNSYGQIGNGESDNRMLIEKEPVKIMDEVKQISAGRSHALAVTTNGDLYVWGNNNQGEVGQEIKITGMGDIPANSQPMPVKIMSDVKMACAGSLTTCAVTNSGELYTWGYNNSGAIGNGEHGEDYPYLLVTKPYKVMSGVVSASIDRNCAAALTIDGTLYMWGDNKYGVIGNGNKGDGDSETKDAIVIKPEKVMDNVASAGIGWAVDKNGNLLMWGNNVRGVLGTGEIDTVITMPVKVMGNVATAATGGNHTLAIDDNGTLYSWGSNEYGEIGNGKKGDGVTTTVDEYEASPVQITLDPQTEKETDIYGKSSFNIAPSDYSVNGIVESGDAIAEGGIVYVASNTTIRKIDVPNKTSESVILKYPCKSLIGIFDGDIYYTGSDGIAYIKTDGSGSTLVYSAEGQMLESYTTANSKYIYFVTREQKKNSDGGYSYSDKKIRRLDISTGKASVINDVLNIPLVSEDSLYLYQDSSLLKSDFNGSNTKKITSVGRLTQLYYCNGWIYYVEWENYQPYSTEQADYQLYRLKPDGTEKQKIGTIKTRIFNVAGDYIYYENIEDNGKLYCVKTDGTESRMICDKENIGSISICAGRIFFSYMIFIDEAKTRYMKGNANILTDGSDFIDMA